ncbi:MAG: MFS transporter [Kiritimatiellae bacterium]|nr:MFS transporter [Kiritimatiellia bacterium]
MSDKGKMSNFRWMICSLLFFATTVNYLDRQVLSLTWKDFIAPEFHWTDADYGVITGYFSLIYAFCNLFAGKFVDWMGTKKGYMWAIFIWSLAACLHAACGWGTVLFVDGVDSVAAMRTIEAGSAVALSVASVSVWLFLGCRCMLALGEAGNFPAAIKVTAEYFPPKDRAFSTSIFNSGSSVGALAAPATIPLIAEYCGWEMAFIIIGALGFVWMGFWQFLYKKPAENPRVNAAELAYISSDETQAAGDSGKSEKPDDKGIGYLRAFSLRQTWSLVLGRLLTDGVWWFFLFWTPGYLSDQFGYKSSSGMGMALIVTLYAIVTFASIYLCKLPTWFVDKKGMNAYEGRMVAMFLFACLPLLALGAQPLGKFSAWWPAILIGCACAGHQAWSANIYSCVSDMFPKSCIGTLTGIAQCAAGLGSFLVNLYAGRLFTYAAEKGDAFAFLGYTGKPAGYMIVFCYCAVAYIVGWACMKSLVPRYKKVEL